ncbi:MAG: SLC13 family permease [Longimicrobiales bacterium]|nr:SLC13 family permease [Longimicrobiales bacterium]
MSGESLLFFFIIFVTLILFVKEIFPMDVTALALLTVLLATDLLSLEEAISGFSNQAVLTVGLMFVLSSALVKTGFLEVVADKLSYGNKNSWVTIGFFLLITSITSAFINNTAAVAIFIPLALHLSQRLHISPSKLLIPLSYAGIYGGTITLIGTSTNLLVNSIAVDNGITPFTMFEFSRMGIIFLIIGTAYTVFIVPRILPARAGISSLTRNYHMAPYLTEMEIDVDSPLVGTSLAKREIGKNYGVDILSVIRGTFRFDSNFRDLILKEGDILLVHGTLEHFIELRDKEVMLLLTDMKIDQSELLGSESTIVEGLVTQGSELIGKTLRDLDFRNAYDGFVMAVRREEKTLRDRVSKIPLQFADTLLIFLPKSRLGALNNHSGLAVLQELDVKIHKVRFWWLAIAVIPLIMLTASLGWIDILEAALIGTVILLLAKSISIQEAYKSINWSVIILIAAFVPVGIAMDRSGAADIVAASIIGVGNLFPPDMAASASLSALYLVAAVLTAVLSNNTAAIVLVPVALAISQQLGVDARGLLLAVCFGASTSFMTPMGYQTNLMVYGPGRYHFKDFVTAGLPLSLAFWVLATICIPKFWPF